MPLNSRLLKVAVAGQADKVLREQARKAAVLDFETKKEQFLQAFDAHPVTQELEGGPTAFSRIPALVEAGGNLFSFLGFNKGDDPAGDLREYLDENIKIERRGTRTVRGDRLIYTTKVMFPTVAEIDEAMKRRAPLDWVSRAFTQMISKGIPGLPNYLFRESPKFPSPPSRSGTGLQVDKKLRGGSFGGVPYVGELLGTLKRLFASERSKG